MSERITLQSGPFRLAARLFIPSNGPPPFPALIVCHGLGSRAANHTEFAEFLAGHGWAALTFDFRGHGDSEGWLDEHTVEDVVAAARFLEGRSEIDAERIAVRGSSMGGHFALQAAAVMPRLSAAVAICAAPSDALRRALHDEQAWEWMEQGNMSFRLTLPGFVAYLAGHSLVTATRAIAPRHLLLVHAKGDQSIDYANTVQLYEAAGEPKRLLLLEGGSHTSAQHDPAVHQETLAWLEQVTTRA